MDDMKNRPLVRGDELEEVEQAPGVFRKVAAHGDKAMVCQIRLVKGAVVQSHSHPHRSDRRLYGADPPGGQKRF